MHPILVDAIQHVVVAKEADVWEVSLLRLKGGVAGLDAWVWRRHGWDHRGVFQR